jgi:hypothetical protein
VVDEEIRCLGRRDQARLEDAWPAEAPSNQSPSGWERQRECAAPSYLMRR